MKIKIRPDDVSMVEINDWLAELRDNDRAESVSDGGPRPEAPATRPPSSPAPHAEPGTRTEAASDGRPRPEAPATRPPSSPAPHAEPRAWPEPRTRTEPGIRSDSGTRAESRTWPQPRTRAEITVRAVIGDQLRIPIMWCEMGSCISRHADPAALGEADIRARAIAVGWRVDALGRLACPQCQQTASGFRSPCPVSLWDRDEAIIMTVRMAAVLSGAAVGSAAGGNSEDSRRSASGPYPATPPGPGRHRRHPAAATMPAHR